jgi:hypothetical protein
MLSIPTKVQQKEFCAAIHPTPTLSSLSDFEPSYLRTFILMAVDFINSSHRTAKPLSLLSLLIII